MVKVAREKIVRVADVMTPAVVTLLPRTPLGEAAALLADARITGAPVVTAGGRLLGMLSRSDLADPRHQTPGATVEGAMTRVLYAVRPSDPVMAAVKLMVMEAIHRVVVVDETGAMVGILTSMDILRSLLPEGEEAAPLEYLDVTQSQRPDPHAPAGGR